MKLTILSLLATVGVLGREASCTDNLTVRTSTGTFTGIIDPEFPNTRQFRAVPFAEPPVASRRWLPPQKLSTSPDEHRYVPRFPPSCPQFVSGVPNFYNGELTKGNLIYNGAQNDTSGLVGEATSEDCLYLAVWTPAADAPRPDDGFPVLFFMTGGGFMQGGVDIPWQMPTGWVERAQDFIIVTINYRIDVFGFPNARGLEDQNLGILDQRAALEWVRDNVEAFGGDPTRITQWGRSAGAFSVDIHAYAYADDPIAQGYFMNSGTALFPQLSLNDPTHSNFTYLADHFGCSAPSSGDVDEDAAAQYELDCMRLVPFAQIINFIGQRTDQGETPVIAFRPVPDERIVFIDYVSLSEEGKFAHVPAIISATSNEMVTLVSIANMTEGPDLEAITELTVSGFACPAYNSTVYRNREDVPVFRLQVTAEFPNANYYDWLGAYHACDITIPFGTYELLDHIAPSTQYQADVSQAMQDRIIAFVKDPVNGPQEEFGWEPQDTSAPDGGFVLRLGINGEVTQRIDGFEVDGVCEGLREYDSFPGRD